MKKRAFKKMLKPILTGEIIYKHFRKVNNAKFPNPRSNNSRKLNRIPIWHRKYKHVKRMIPLSNIHRMYRKVGD